MAGVVGAPDLSEDEDELLRSSLLRVTDGLPNVELKLMVSEAAEVEPLLEQDIQLLEKAISEGQSLSETDQDRIESLLASELSTADQFYTVSALLGRMRKPLAMPLPPNSSIHVEANVDDEKSQQLDFQKSIVSLDTNPEYRRIHDDTTELMALWKKISSHKTAAVFRRPVNPKEAPGYTERIAFPIDLSLIRKMIIARVVVSYADLHERIGLVCHNCLKYNGRESDYGVVTRDFAAQADRYIVDAVTEAAGKPALETTPDADGKTTSAANEV